MAGIPGAHRVQPRLGHVSRTSAFAHFFAGSPAQHLALQVDRKCHLISASSFDKMCQDMLNGPRDDLSGDVYPHGARELVATHLAANNQVRK